MTARAKGALFAVAVLVAVTASGACKKHAPPPLDLGPLTSGPLVFPPPLEGWQDRAALEASDFGGPRDRVRVTSPKLDAARHFTLEGKVVRLAFTEAVVEDVAKAPALRITPPVKGTTVWRWGTDAEFRADAPFDPDVDYTVSVPSVTAPSGRTLDAFQATFRATPLLEIGGKTVRYLPKKGEARPIVTLPNDGGKLGVSPRIRVLYDQPVDLALARSLVSVEGSDGKAFDVSIDHATEAALEGQPVDRRMVVVVRPKRPLAAGEALTVKAKAQVGEETKVATVTMSEPVHVTRVACGYGDKSDCDGDEKHLLGDPNTSIRVTYNNPITGLDAKRHVTVTPTPRNVWVESWGETLRISGSFAPGATYAVRVASGADDYGNPIPPASLTFETRPLPASAVVPEGALVLSGEQLRAFPVSTRNVEAGEVRVIALPKGDIGAMKKALKDLRVGLSPSGDTKAVAFAPRGKRDAFVDTFVDLSGATEAGRAYVVEAVVAKAIRNARQTAYASGSPAAQPGRSFVVAAGDRALAAHVHRDADRAAVTAFWLTTGEPAAGAKITIGASSEIADAHGTALVKLDPTDSEPLCEVSSGDASAIVALGAPSGRSAGLFPALSEGSGEGAGGTVGMILTDRGIYRPGSSMHVKAYVRRIEGAAVKPVPSTKVRLEIRDARDAVMVDEVVSTDARGTLTRDVTFEAKAHTGRVRIAVLEENEPKRTIASETVRVAAFEAPRFKVDVENDAQASAGNVKARVVGRYLFGSPMAGGRLAWTLKKQPMPVDGGALGAAGMSFADDSYWDEGDDREATKPLTGEAELDAAGTAALDIDPGVISTSMPTELVLEADVTDPSHRHVTSSMRTRRDPAGKHAGVRLARRFGGVGGLRVELAAVDGRGQPIIGEPLTARLEHVTYSRVAETAESGAVVERWKSVVTPAGTCEATSAAEPVSCELSVARGGSYRVTASVRGLAGARTGYWAYKEGEPASPVPSEGKKLELVLDKASYGPGETAHVFVPSPYAAATAVLTIEQGGILSYASKRIDGASGTFDVPIGAASAPHTHAAVTLLPIGGGEADYRLGVVRIPVGTEHNKLAVTVSSSKKSYGVREVAEVTIQVRRDGAPVKDADVALSVVDEGVLRLTGFHPPDPAKALHPGRSLDFSFTDTRQWLLQRRERAHVAGGGDDGGEESVNTRKNFVETAAFMPSLTTDAEGRVKATFTLPDNLTELRMMAVAVDAVGRGGTAESSFVVTKPVLVDPVMPRFALRGDAFEAAAMVHNTTSAEVRAEVTIGKEQRSIVLPAASRQRVAVPMKAEATGTRPVSFAVTVAGKEVDRAETTLRVEEPGVLEHPQLAGVFGREREVTLAIPADATFEPGASLVIRTGSSLYPELGQRLAYLLDYPHGCAEQTVSSTLPLLAARTLVPWTGTTPLPDEELDRRIKVGIERLASMQVDGGGLAYWPGGHGTNTFATAYAMRVLVRAGPLALEKTKLLEGVTTFLTAALEDTQGEDRIWVAEALALAGKLPASSADALWDQREAASTFGLGSLAIALGSLQGQDDRVKDLLDRLEKEFDGAGAPTKKHDESSFYSWGSEDRDRAQAVLALARFRPGSPLLPVLATRLSRGLDGYTTQATAWSLLALAAYLEGKPQSDAADVALKLEGHVLDTTQRLGGGGKEVRIPLADLRGKRTTLLFRGDDKAPSAFSMDAAYRRPLAAAGGGLVQRHGPHGASIHRFYTDASGSPVDLAKIKVGQTIRVAVAITMPKLEAYRLSYLAVTDHLPAGLEPAEGISDASPSDVPRAHPLYEELTRYGLTPDHVDIRDDRVQVYFDRMYAGETAYATYLARATTPGTFKVPPTHGELMYEPGSDGYGDVADMVILP